MKLSSLANAVGSIAVSDDEEYEIADDGSVEVPESLGQQLLSMHVAGKPQWETESGKQVRELAEYRAKLADPVELALLLGASATPPEDHPATADDLRAKADELIAEASRLDDQDSDAKADELIAEASRLDDQDSDAKAKSKPGPKPKDKSSK